jgi:hypothetical protein
LARPDKCLSNSLDVLSWFPIQHSLYLTLLDINNDILGNQLILPWKEKDVCLYYLTQSGSALDSSASFDLQLSCLIIRNKNILSEAANKKAESTVGSSFGSSAIFFLKDPPLSFPTSRKVWLYRVSLYNHYLRKS